MESTTQSQQAPPQPVQPDPPPPPKPRNYSGILIAILLLVIGVLVGLELTETPFISSLRSKYLGATPTPTLVPTPSQAPTGALANWQTYTTAQFGFSLQYPEGWSVQEEHNKIMQAPYFGSKTSDSVNFTMDNSYLKIITGVEFDSSGIGALLKTEQTIVSGKNGVKDTYTISNQRVATTEIVIKFPNSSPFYRIEAVFPTADASTINQILSTFKFLDEPRKCLQIIDPCNPQGCNYDQSKCNN